MIGRVLIGLLAVTPVLHAGASDERDATLDERGLRSHLQSAEQDHAKRARELKQDQFHLLVPALPVIEPRDATVSAGMMQPGAIKMPAAEPVTAESPQWHPPLRRERATEPVIKSEPEQPSVRPQPTTPKKERSRTRKRVARVRDVDAHREDYYFPPSALISRGRKIALVGEDFEQDRGRVVFGIPLGTEIQGRVRRTSTNVQPGLIEIVVTETIRGDKDDLRAGSKLFAEPSVVRGSARLYLSVVRGITPANLEFRLRANVNDKTNAAGLAAVIQSDGRLLKRSATKSALALGASVLGNIAGVSGAAPVGTAVDAFGGNVLDETQEQASAALGGPVFTVSAQPQDVIVAVEETF